MVSLHGDHLMTISCLAASLGRSVVVYRSTLQLCTDFALFSFIKSNRLCKDQVLWKVHWARFHLWCTFSSLSFPYPVTRLAFASSQFNSSDGQVVRASASGAVDSGLIPSRIKPMTLKLVFTASLLDAHRTVWRTSRQVYLSCRWERHLTGFPHSIGRIDRFLVIGG